ncbi:type VI secretion system-associated FHA domain protein TagH [Vibrio diabolicus]|uniref:type VI secretion system-associated FHA domain protein TagH n=1 Tax=Vibrio diabolicus TaxID=50719 RepID=UPI0015F51B2C|nr:type VI secretion system-associated FHA domain protein TagH [Vibrio diabolicus]
MNKPKLPSLTLLVTNAQRLESGLSAQYTWKETGGIIGAATTSEWRLTDSDGQVSSEHCEVVVLDGAYCLKDICGSTYVNGAHLPLGKGQLARLNHKDEVSIGPYQLRILFGNANEVEEQHGSLDALFTSQDEDLLSDLAYEEEPELESEGIDADPLNALDELMGSQEANENRLIEPDPEQRELPKQSLVPDEDLGLPEVAFTPQADSEYEMTSSIRLKKILGFGFNKLKPSNKEERINVSQSVAQPTQLNKNDSNVSEGFTMDEKVLDLLEEEVAKSIQPQTETFNQSNTQTNHLITGPMLDGLGVDLSHEDNMARMHLLSQEMGESLQACVRGLLDLHQQVSEGRFGTLNRNLQPIEDNPLRLGLSYEETVKTLYDADKSLVHLSAPAAIAESLKTVRDHNEAMQHATADALSQILTAFSPEVMLRRFHHYKRTTDTTQTTSDEWAWKMYCNYYRELTSNRQRGFEKLFWEIFEQSYDRKIREKQREL